jgi:flagellin
LATISGERGNIGASMSRISVALNNLGVMNDNYTAAYSRIMDPDVASEAAEMTKNQILQQVGASVLGQANQSPQIALQLLKL